MLDCKRGVEFREEFILQQGVDFSWELPESLEKMSYQRFIVILLLMIMIMIVGYFFAVFDNIHNVLKMLTMKTQV